METFMQVLEIAGAFLAGVVATLVVVRTKVLPPLIEAARLTESKKDDEILAAVDRAFAAAEAALLPFVARTKQAKAIEAVRTSALVARETERL